MLSRNRDFHYPEGEKEGWHRCDICLNESTFKNHLVNAHVVAHAHARTLFVERKTNEMLVSSPSYVNNGLLLCPQCDSHFEDHNIIITGDGTLMVSDATRDESQIYAALHNKKVAWANKINQAMDWPNSATLNFRNTLHPVCVKRKNNLEIDTDCAGSNSDDEHEHGTWTKRSKSNATFATGSNSTD